MNLYDVLYILSNVFLSHIICRFIYLFYEKCRLNKYLEFLAYFIYFISITFVFMYFGNPVITISFNIGSIFLLTLMYDYINVRKSIITTLLIYLFLFVIETSILVTISFNDGIFFVDDRYKNIMVLMVTYTIEYILYLFLLNIKKIYVEKLELVISNKLCIVFGIYVILSIIVIFFNSLIGKDLILTILINLVVVFSNIILFKYCNFILRNIYEKIFGNFMNDRIATYKKEIGLFEKNSNLNVYVMSGNKVIDSILNSKIFMLDKDVKLILEISIKDNLRIKSSDLIVIVGNLMDNALFGVDSVSAYTVDKYIYMKIKYIKGIIIFKVKNSCNRRNLRRMNVSTKYKNFYELNIFSIKEVVGKYKGNFEIKFRKSNFEINILIYDTEI